MHDQITETAGRWAQAVRSREAENVLKLYHPDGSLWGTLAQEYRHGHDAIYDYFVRFLDKEELKCRFQQGRTRIYDDFAFYSGSYEFTWKVSGKEIILPARFSFVYKKSDGKWLIMEHHSSLYPEQPFRLRKFIKK